MISANTLEGKNVVVTGGAGFIGSHLVDRLIGEQPARITVVDNLWLGTEANLADARRRRPDLILHQIDATSYASMRAALLSPVTDVLFDLATIPLTASLKRPRWVAEQLTKMAAVASELARRGFVGTLVRCSSSEVYGTAEQIPMSEEHPLRPETPYASGKAAGDLIIESYRRTFAIDSTVVRPFNNYGPRQNEHRYVGVIPQVLLRLATGAPPIIEGDGLQTRDYTFVADTVEAIIRAYQNPASRGLVINIASGSEITIRDLVHRLIAAYGVNVTPIHTTARPGDVRRHVGDIRRAKEVLGFAPIVPIDEGIQRTVTWFRSRFSGRLM